MSLENAVQQGIIAHQFLAYSMSLTQEFLLRVGVSPDKLRFRQHMKDEMAHYAIDCWDAEILSDRFGWVEIVGIADRTDYDLKAHSKVSKTDLSVYVEYDEPKVTDKLLIKPDMGKIGPVYKGKAKAVVEALQSLDANAQQDGEIRITVDGEQLTIPPDMFQLQNVTETVRGENIVPHVIEPSFGIDRITYAVLEHAYREEDVEGEDESRIVLGLKSEVAPVQVAILPLLTRQELIGPAREIESSLKKKGIMVGYDDSGTIGRRYRRNDEIGTPYSITIDYDTLEDGTVTIRDMETMKQVRSPVKKIADTVFDLIYGDLQFQDAGTPVT
jgi:glycyl-tRNA synthetase